MKLPTLLTLLTIAGILGGFGWKAADWLGLAGGSPGKRLETLEASDSVIRAKIDTLTDLTLMLVSMQCLDADSAKAMAARQARVPCARVLFQQGINYQQGRAPR